MNIPKSMYFKIVLQSTFHHDYIRLNLQRRLTSSNKVGKQTFIIKLDGLTAVRCSCKIALVNNTRNINLVLMF